MIDVLNLPSLLLCGIAVEMALTPAVLPTVGPRDMRQRNGVRQNRRPARAWSGIWAS